MKIVGRAWRFGDNISTDDIIPGRFFHLRGNIKELARHTFEDLRPEFSKVVRPGDIIVAGENFGIGSSREHAAIAPKYLGIKAVIVKSFARIHRANLINFGIMPLIFDNPEDYDKIEQGHKLKIDYSGVDSGKLILQNLTTGEEYPIHHDLSEKELEIIKVGGLLPWIKKKQEG